MAHHHYTEIDDVTSDRICIKTCIPTSIYLLMHHTSTEYGYLGLLLLLVCACECPPTANALFSIGYK